MLSRLPLLAFWPTHLLMRILWGNVHIERSDRFRDTALLPPSDPPPVQLDPAP
jgi:hypothetical protein